MQDLFDIIERIRADRKLGEQIDRIESYLQAIPPRSGSGEGPVLFFNASTRIHRLSINAAISLIASWGLRQAGIPVLHAVCQRGMVQCVLGTNRDNLAKPPPCKHCVAFSKRLFRSELVLPVVLDSELVQNTRIDLQQQKLEELISWRYKGIPLGELCIPGFRWALRRHNLPDAIGIRTHFGDYLASGANLVERFEEILENNRPRALVVFNGISFPEAIARHLAKERGIPVITHEVGLRPYSAFFSHKDATFREVEFPSEAPMKESEEIQLSEYLEDRFKGQFSMAGIKFWPEITDIPEELEEKIDQHQQLVPIFTNVIFDTSQIHANTIFKDMFSWLKRLVDTFQKHPETLFIIRAHPDEDRLGKESRESVKDWFEQSRSNDFPNVFFLPPSETISSYDLIRRAKVVLVYNSSIGLEASIMGAPVLCAGRARYTQIPTTFFPESRHAYFDQLDQLLDKMEIQVPGEFASNARKFLYHELYRSSLDLSDYLRPYPNQSGMTLLRAFEPSDFEQSPAIKVIREGILEKKTFEYP